ncbi:TetR family transcriptional regulator [Tahibacter aquaticus]|uniref:TetR family transcriptional regulator n=1 Tax=Tahibacter aquaticus TaxID=520092 RepID=A0A4R6YQW2_9GAMM|nr:TetR/AcrR family transcriptional regulator [Tahibacter aquaticus]TDR40381.1 TetR family transcriptional regulator [Tahibacter aquaticus]
MSRPPASPPRRRGRPAAHSGPGSAADVRAQLLQSALQLFAEQGIAATPLSQIARKAQVTPALLHYYFGSKEKLVEALVEEHLLPLSAQLGLGLASGPRTLREAIEALVGNIMDLLGANPWFPQLWVREVLHEGGQLRHYLVQRMAPALALKVRDLVAAAQARGEINADIEPRLFMVSLIGLTVFPFAAQPVWRAIYPADDITPQTLRKHVLALLLHGLEPRSPSTAPIA